MPSTTNEFLQTALEKLKERKGLDRYGQAIAEPVAAQLQSFCEQDAEFAQAVAQGGSYPACLKAVTKGVGCCLSDLEAYKKAVQFYFPTADVRMQLTIDLAPHASVPDEMEQDVEVNKMFSQLEEAKPKSTGIVLNFEDFFGGL